MKKFISLSKTRKYSKKIFSIHAKSSNGMAMVTLKPLIQVERVPTNLCCVVDTSGSMATESLIQNAQGIHVKSGLSTLDLVKHSLKTIIATLKENDTLSIVGFGTSATVYQTPLEMNKINKEIALKNVENLYEDGNTNLWDGLSNGMNLVQDSKGKNSSVFLLTDGMPNINPPRGFVPSMIKYKEKNRIPLVNTFGFGKNIDSRLLYDLSNEGSGSYSFIPDGSFVGTIFVNALSNLLTTVATNVKITVENSSITGFKKTSSGSELDIGSLNLTQERSIVFPTNSKHLSLKVEYFTPYSNEKVTENYDIIAEDSHSVDFYDNQMRTLAASLLTSESKSDLTSLINEIKFSPKKSPYLNDLLKDLEGEGSLALKDYYEDWGKHYILSLGRTHFLQQCNNFKDPGIQHYGGSTFNKIRDEIDSIFLSIPPPLNKNIESMVVFYDRDNPCFEGSGIVRMKQGYKQVSDIRKGDLLFGNKKVICVVKTKINNKKAKLIDMNGVKVSPWHPFKINSKYDFPYNHGKTQLFDCDAIYNFVVEGNSSIIINDIEFLTLGHNLKEENAQHDYFGTEKVINDLMKMNGWEDGLVELNEGCVLKDESGKVMSMIQDSKKIFQIQNPSILA